VKADYYQQFDADLSLDVPGEGYGGWKSAEIDIGRAGLVVMHAWDTGTPEEFPGWHRCVEYIPRAEAILREVFPPLLATARSVGFPVVHVVGGGKYFQDLPGYRRAVALAGPTPDIGLRGISDPSLETLQRFRSEHVFVGKHNEPDVIRGFERLDFAPAARPLDTEGIAENGHQLCALCNDLGVNHLIYVGFAINWCLLLSPGGMWEMSQRGFLCSTIRQATTAVENRESARKELCKEMALWRVALAFGFVFDLEDFLQEMRTRSA
jgi:nicotinamidase-related amidase